jgi:hypothetical protein
MPMAKPMNNWLKISFKPSAVAGSMRGTSSCMDKKMVSTMPMATRMRRFTARIEKIDDKIGLNHLILNQINPFLTGWINGLLVFELNSKTQPIFKKPPSDIKIESEGIRFYFS